VPVSKDKDSIVVNEQLCVTDFAQGF